jgi:esterase/lipase
LNRRTGWILAAAVALAALLWWSTPPALHPYSRVPVLPDDLDAWLDASERQVDAAFGLLPDTAKRIRWADGRQQTEYAVVYLHGFSATRQETAPLAELVADALGANLFETRLSGHGYLRDGLVDVQAEAWLADGAEALAIAQRLGERTIVIATSTGASIVAAMLDHPGMATVDTIVMVSPNFAPQGAGAAWLTRPAGPLLARLVIGEYRSWETDNAAQMHFWTTHYPVATIIEVMRLVNLANRQLPASIPQRLLMFYDPQDSVVSVQAALQAFAATDARMKTAIAVADSGDPSHHVLAGDILSPATTEDIAATIVEFIRRPEP